MINSPESSIKLTDVQTAQIEETKSRLLNLESEISIATKNIKATKADTEKVIKERIYEEELLSTLKEKTSEAKKELDGVINEIGEAQVVLKSCHELSDSLDKANAEKSTELESRERALEESEKAHKKEVEEFTINTRNLLKDKLSVETAKEAFVKATETVTW